MPKSEEVSGGYENVVEDIPMTWIVFAVFVPGTPMRKLSGFMS
jgi:hypothetical protein